MFIEKRILLTVRGRIGKKSVKGILEFGFIFEVDLVQGRLVNVYT